MTTSERRLRASRVNSRLGGPKSDEGKAISRMNATRHGVLAVSTTAYDPIDLAEVYAAFAAEFGVETLSRRVLVEQLALTAVRLARCARAEAEIIREGLNPRKVTTDDEQLVKLLHGERVVSEGELATLTGEFLERMGVILERYEPRLVNRYLKLLEALRARAPEQREEPK